jgi:hypothetical protein
MEGRKLPLLRGLYIAIIMERYGGTPNFTYYSLAWRPLLSHYNGPLWRATYCLI